MNKKTEHKSKPTNLKDQGAGEYLLETKALGTSSFDATKKWGMFYVLEGDVKGTVSTSINGPEKALFTGAIGEPEDELFSHEKGTAHPAKGTKLRVKLVESKKINSYTGKPFVNIVSVEME